MSLRTLYVRSGYWAQMAWPHGASVKVEIAPPTHPSSLLGFAFQDNNQLGAHVYASEVDEIRASSQGWTFFGFGASGTIAAGLASAIDGLLAPWTLWFT